MELGRKQIRQANKQKKRKVILIVILAIVFAAVSAGGYWYFRISDDAKMFPGRISFPEADAHGKEIMDIREAFSKDAVNILLMGFDRNEDRKDVYSAFRADTIMLASINIETGKVDVISIPRDTLVPIYNRGGGRDKINSAYTYGWRYGGGSTDEEKFNLGMLYQVETISMALKGVPIHYYVSVDMDAVVQIVDTLGGVEYNVPNNIYHKTGRVLLGKGQQVLNGQQFLIFVRNRNYRLGDLQRVKNQQDILLALFKQIKSAGNIVKIPKIYSSVVNNAKTNLSLEQIMSLAHFATQNVDTDNIGTHVLSTSFALGRIKESWTKSYSYLIIDQKARAQMLYDIWGLDVMPDATDVIYPPLPQEPEPADEEEPPLAEEEPPTEPEPAPEPVPVEPGPENPEDPQDPQIPTDPENPEDPEKPEDPQDPENPEDPQEPEEPPEEP